MTSVKNIAIIGSGNTANFLAVQFFSKQFNIQQIISRNAVSGQNLAAKVNASYSNDYVLNDNIDLVLLCVPDNQISVCAERLNVVKAMVCHCAGSVDINVLSKFQKHGVMYPVQSLSDKLRMNGLEVPFLIEANTDDCLTILKNMVGSLGYGFYEVNSETRLHYHLVAVFVNNFANGVILAASEISDKHNLYFSFFKPLLFQTFEKLKVATPFENQTGPAKRNDLITIQKHLDLLSDNDDLFNIYQSVSHYITQKFKPAELQKDSGSNA